MLEELFKFFEFQDLRFEFCGGFVAIGRRTCTPGSGGHKRVSVHASHQEFAINWLAEK